MVVVMGEGRGLRRGEDGVVGEEAGEAEGGGGAVGAEEA